MPEIERAPVLDELTSVAPKVLPYADTAWKTLDEARRSGKRILFEGAQGTMLDIDHGTYPFVTSSNTRAGQARRLGVDPVAIDHVLGVAKAYTTRVGTGPFPTELDWTGRLTGERGREFGAITGACPPLRLVRRGAGTPSGEGQGITASPDQA